MTCYRRKVGKKREREKECTTSGARGCKLLDKNFHSKVHGASKGEWKDGWLGWS